MAVKDASSVMVVNGNHSATIQYFGGHITSWKVNHSEMLYMSSMSVRDGTKAIRGGIPIVFPNFGPWPEKRPQHGFARICLWKCLEESLTPSNCVTMVLDDNEMTREMWDVHFLLSMKVSLTSDGALTQSLHVENMSREPINFTALLHTYFSTRDIDETSILGLEGLEYTDKTDGAIATQRENKFVITKETDRIYGSVPDTLIVHGLPHTIHVRITSGFRDAVVWNPWIERAKAISDMADDDYKYMICVELGCVTESGVTLSAGETWQAGQELSIEDNNLNN